MTGTCSLREGGSQATERISRRFRIGAVGCIREIATVRRLRAGLVLEPLFEARQRVKGMEALGRVQGTIRRAAVCLGSVIETPLPRVRLCVERPGSDTVASRLRFARNPVKDVPRSVVLTFRQKAFRKREADVVRQLGEGRVVDRFVV
jgi:hypothetical protein